MFTDQRKHMITMSHPNASGPASSNQTPTTDVIQIDLGDFLQRRKGLILLCAAVGLVLAALYCLTTPTIYESNANILVIPKDSKLTTSANAEFGFESTAGDELLATHMQIITSPTVITKALRENDLFRLPSLIQEVTEPDQQQDERRRKIVKYVRENLSVKRGGDGATRDAQVLDVTFQHKSDADCAEILLSIIDQYQDYLDEKITDAGTEAAELIEEASGKLLSELKQKDGAYKDFLQDSPALLGGTDVNPQQIMVTQLQTELSTIQIRRAEVESRLALTKKVRAKPKDSSASLSSILEKLTVLDKDDIDRVALLVQLERGYPNSEAFAATLPTINEAANVEFQQLMQLKAQVRQNEVKYGEQHPEAVATRKQIEELEQLLAQHTPATPKLDRNTSPNQTIGLDQLVAVYERLLTNDLDDLSSRETELFTLIDQEKAIAKEVALAQVEQNNLQRDIERTQGLYDTVLDRLGEINLLKDYGGFITDVISPVEIGEKAWPSIPIVSLLGIFLGMLTGTGIAVVAELADHSFRNPQDIEHELGAPILTHIGLFHPQDIPVADGSQVDRSIVALHTPRSRHAESFRSLRTSIFFRTKSIAHPVLQITSPNAGDGKSTTAANLAVLIAQTGKSVLLVDADMRRPMVNRLFGIDEQAAGLAEVLQGEAGIDEVLTSSGVDNLTIMTCGRVPTNPAELLALPDFSDLLEQAKQQFDYILLDSPPVTPVADPLTVASVADFVIVAMTLRKNSRAAATRTCSDLSKNGADILGIVVNRAVEQNENYGYSYSRYGGTQYGQGYRYGRRGDIQSANDAYYS